MTSHGQHTRFGDRHAGVPVRRVFLVLVAGALIWAVASIAGSATPAHASAPDPGVSAPAFVPDAQPESPAGEAEPSAGPPVGEGRDGADGAASAEDAAGSADVADDGMAAAEEPPPPAEERAAASGESESPPVSDGAWASQLGAWHAQNDQAAVEAAKKAAHEARADDGEPAASPLPQLADRMPAAAVIAVVSLGAALALLAAGRHARARTVLRTPVPTMRRPIQ